MEISNIKNQISKIQTRYLKIFTFLACVFGFLFLIFGFLTGCVHLKEYAHKKQRRLSIATEDLKGLSKVDIVKKLGEPQATSKSEVSECWYYADPGEIWIWFKENKVERWETK